MNWKIPVTLVALVTVVAGGVLFVYKAKSRSPVTVTLRIGVQPREQVDFVLAQANSAKFKYLAGKLAGVKPVLAQRLTLKPLPDAPVIEARAMVETAEEGRRYTDGFIETLQMLCGNEAKVALQ